MSSLAFEPTYEAVAAAERAGTAEPVALAFTYVAEAEVIPAQNREDPRT